ncbi:MAG: hypothetical protein V1913_17635, partial [Fibrobacterota bacterium]
AIIRAMVRRPFARTVAWPDSLWEPIERLYRRILADCNPGTYGEQGMLTGFDEDLLNRSDAYFMLSNWAALCGRTGPATAYLDSADRFWTSLVKTCMNSSRLGGRSQELCGYLPCLDVKKLTGYRKNMLRFMKARILLRSDSLALADSCIREMLREGADMDDVDWKAKAESFEWERRFLARIPQPDTGRLNRKD